jgi:excisionase family DNA binding protein
VSKAEDRRLVTCKTAAELTGTRENTWRKWIAQRRVPSVRLGRTVRVSMEAIEKFIAENTVPAVRQ